MKHFQFLIKLILIFFVVAVSFSSCFVTSRSNLGVFNNNEYAQSVSIKSIKVPKLIAKPFLRKYLRHEENVTKEVNDLVRGFKNVKITFAQTTNRQLIHDFRSAIKHVSGEEWISVQNGDQWLYLKADQNPADVIKRITVAISLPEEGQLIYIKLRCKLTPDQLSKLINTAMDSDEGKNIFRKPPTD